MPVRAKICGINDAASMRAAVAAGASHVGLVFDRPSPRYVTPAEAAALTALAPSGIAKVGLFVDADDAEIDAVAARIVANVQKQTGGVLRG